MRVSMQMKLVNDRIHLICKQTAPISSITEKVMKKEELLRILQPCIQIPDHDEAKLKMPCLNLEAGLMMVLDCGIGAKVRIPVPKGLFHKLGMPEEAAWEAARENAGFRIRALDDLLSEKHGAESVWLLVSFDVLTASYENGASALLYPSIFESYCREKQARHCRIIPASKSELLLLPEKYDFLSNEGLINIEHKANREFIPEHQQLEAVLYRYSLDTNTIEIIKGENR